MMSCEHDISPFKSGFQDFPNDENVALCLRNLLVLFSDYVCSFCETILFNDYVYSFCQQEIRYTLDKRRHKPIQENYSNNPTITLMTYKVCKVN